ncbi:MAG: methanogenesis marker 12 protein [Methanomicrobiales archaeon]|jgi:putative methanogenesis marker protein 12|nr:methanogenesis marker 12 protein [Methanomicrobiales archaeon]
MFIGIDHGTTAIRFATHEKVMKIPRQDAVFFDIQEFASHFPLNEILGIALTYSMGDNFSAISSIDHLVNRGVMSQKGAGKHTGGGTKIFDTLLASDLPVIVIPGIHKDSPTDPRFKIYSHQASPEKVGIAYYLLQKAGPDIIMCDASSNTVSLLIKDGKVVGGFDACLFAPGRIHGALDLEAIRAIDAQEMSANDAFLHAGTDTKCTSMQSESEKMRTLAMFAAMECAALRLLAPQAKVALSGSLAEDIHAEVSFLLDQEVLVFDEWAAARGLCMIAEAVYHGAQEIVGLGVLENAIERGV